jgi:phosphatidylglycerol lysyltransferase
MNDNRLYRARLFFQKIYWKEILAVLLLFIAVYFFRTNRQELMAIQHQLHQANELWLLGGLILTILYIFLQAMMYVAAFAAVKGRLHWFTGVELFLKRNLLSIFLPAGGVSSLAYTPSRLRKEAISKTQIHQASAIYAFAGMATVFIVGLPVLIYSLVHSANLSTAWMGIVVVALMITGLILATLSLQKKGSVYQWIIKKFPGWKEKLDELFGVSIDRKYFLQSILYSVALYTFTLP